MHTLIVMFKNIIMELDQINISVVNDVSLNGYLNTWKILNMVDRLCLSDTDERAKVITRSRTKIVGVDNIELKGLTTGPK